MVVTPLASSRSCGVTKIPLCKALKEEQWDRFSAWSQTERVAPELDARPPKP